MPTSNVAAVPYTKWYRVWERTSLSDFKLEMNVIPFLLVVILVHMWGSRKNRRKAKAWARAHGPLLAQEYAQVGYVRPNNADPLAEEKEVDPDMILREKKTDEYHSYATGRQNVAFVDFKLTLLKRYNPLARFGELAISLFVESMPAPTERLEATAYAFDGAETKIVPKFIRGDDGIAKKVPNSTYDGFVFGIVHKDLMKRLREDRYDLSLTSTKDHAKLPVWTTVMSESAEITEKMLTPELIKAVHDAGDLFEALIVTDQPMDHPRKLDDTTPRKRINYSIKLASDYTPTLPLFNYFLRLPDFLAQHAHFRPEALRRIKQTRDEQIARIRRAEEEEKAEERKLESDRVKKELRDQKLKSMSAEQQTKYLAKEREKEMRKGQKKVTRRA